MKHIINSFSSIGEKHPLYSITFESGFDVESDQI